MGSDAHQFDRAYWEDRYAASELAWSGNPNPVLVAEASKLRPGRVLDVGSGEGADALWLAQQGWQVTGADISKNALDKARAHAEAADQTVAERIDWQQRDVTVWSPPSESYDLVSSQFMHLPEPTRSDLFRSLAAAVAPGGTLLIVGHDISDLDADSHHRAHLGDRMFTVEEVLSAISDQGLRIEVAESRRRQGNIPQGSEFIHDVVVMASRTP